MRVTLPLLLLPLAACTTPTSDEQADSAPLEASTTNRLESGGHDVHAMLAYLAESSPFGLDGAGEVLSLPLMLSMLPFNEVVPSWNVALPDGAGFRAELRVWGHEDGALSSWYDLGTWGEAPQGPEGPSRDEHGVVDVDVFRSERTFDAVEVRFVLRAAPDGSLPRAHRVWLCVSNTTGDAELAEAHGASIDPVAPELWQRRLDVPFRSQRSEDPAIAGRICSPTSVAMVMDFHGVERPTALIARRAYDAEHDIYGGWARAVQAAFEEGVPGCVTRFASLEEVYRHIAEGRPVIASIRARPGELRGAPYESTGGHLIVITGFDTEGNVHVNDPATADPAEGITTYAREDMQRVWIGRGGVAYVLSRPEP